MAVEHQIAIIYAVTNGYLDDVEPSGVREWETDFHQFLNAQHEALLTAIRTKKELEDELTAELKNAVERFKALE